MYFLSALVYIAYGVSLVRGYDNSRSDNLAVYYGQNSYGQANPSDTANWQQDIGYYCQDNTINAIPIAFLNVFFSTGGLPEINLANICSSAGTVFPGTSLANCQFLASDIEACQAKGKIVTISMGGASGAAYFTSDAQGTAFANTVWNLFLGGSSSTRPFGSAVLDGVDLDIEGGGSTGYAAFVTQIRALASGASKQYYITGAPQCPYPDAYLGSVINAVGFDALYVQFYNNYCNVGTSSFDFSTWDNWAKTVSPNKNVKIFIGAPASSTAANSGYISASALGTLAKQTQSQYSSFGGVMLWDASQAYANGRYDIAIKNAIAGGTVSTTSSTTSTTTTSTTTSKTTTTTTSTTSNSGSGSCSGVSAWVSDVAYVGGDQVTYNGHLWTAMWWTYDDIPGGAAGVWTDDGACASLVQATAAAKTSVASSAKVTASSKSISVKIQPKETQAAAKETAAATADENRRALRFMRS